MILRNSEYAVCFGREFRFFRRNNGMFRLQSEYDSDLLKKGFIKYTEAELNNQIYLDVQKDEIQSAYQALTYCTYNGATYFLDFLSDKKAIIAPNESTKKQLGLHIYDDARIEIARFDFEKFVNKIWEERIPIEGFIFDVEPIVYVKQ